MKAKNILMSVLLAMGFIAAKAAGYPPELALVSQPVLVYNYNSITVYYDVQNIGDYTYRGDICLFLSPDNGYCYAEKYVKVRPGRIKRVAMEIPAYRTNLSFVYTIMPYYEMGEELYSFTTFEYFEPLSFYWNGYHNEPWVVINVPPRPRYYTRPGSYRYYYDGFRPPMPPPPGMSFGTGTLPPPMDPLHHTYGYHHNNGGYPAWNNEWNNGNTPPKPNDNGSSSASQATVRPKANGGSMSGGTNHSNHSGNKPPANNNGRTGSNSNVGRPNNNTGSNSGTVNNGSNRGRTGNSGSVSRPNNNGSSNSGTAAGRTGNTGSNVRSGSNSGSNSGTSSNSNSRTSGGSNSGSRSGNNTGRGSR